MRRTVGPCDRDATRTSKAARTARSITGPATFAPVARYGAALIKLVPTEWGPPTFEIDGIKMLPTSKVSPYDDARRQGGTVRPRGQAVLDTCGGLGYFAACCLEQGRRACCRSKRTPTCSGCARSIRGRRGPGGALELVHGDVAEGVRALPEAAFDAMLHDPPRFGIAGELYSQAFYAQLARVLRPGGRLFHYTGTPNRLTTGRDVPHEVVRRLRAEGFRTELGRRRARAKARGSGVATNVPRTVVAVTAPRCL